MKTRLCCWLRSKLSISSFSLIAVSDLLWLCSFFYVSSSTASLADHIAYVRHDDVWRKKSEILCESFRLSRAVDLIVAEAQLTSRGCSVWKNRSKVETKNSSSFRVIVTLYMRRFRDLHKIVIFYFLLTVENCLNECE